MKQQAEEKQLKLVVSKSINYYLIVRKKFRFTIFTAYPQI